MRTRGLDVGDRARQARRTQSENHTRSDNDSPGGRKPEPLERDMTQMIPDLSRLLDSVATLVAEQAPDTDRAICLRVRRGPSGEVRASAFLDGVPSSRRSV